MKKLIALVLCGILLLPSGCGVIANNLNETGEDTEVISDIPQNINVDPSGDGIFRTLYSFEYTTLNYLVTGNYRELRAAANIIDGLVEYDSYGAVLPALAESWSHNRDYTVWRFNIRPGQKWVDKDGNAVAGITAHDWVDAARYVNDARNNSALQYMYEEIILNASEYYAQSRIVWDAATAVYNREVLSLEEYFQFNRVDLTEFITFEDVGVTAIDDYTLEYRMTRPIPFFLSILSYASYLPVYGPFLEEQGENFGKDNGSLLFNGAYILAEFEPYVKRIFRANPYYWDRDNVLIQEFHQTFSAEEPTLAPVMFLQGELDEVEYFRADILESWLENPNTKDFIRSRKPDISRSYFYTFNFEPRFDDQYEPDNWIIAVNNENFRKSFMYGLDRVNALSVTEPHNPEILLNNTITPAKFTFMEGKDYTQFDALRLFSERDPFDPEKALEYRDKAKEELTDAGASLPIKVLIPSNPLSASWDEESLAVGQQLEDLLGADFVNFIISENPYAASLSGIRRNGQFAFMKCSWNADYVDPQAWTIPFGRGNSYNFMHTDEYRLLDGLPATSKTEETQAITAEYYSKIDAAIAETANLTDRYRSFAEAEAMLIQHAIIIPFSVGSNGYTATYRDPFSGMFSPIGLPSMRYKGVRFLEQPMSNDEFLSAYAEWKARMIETRGDGG